MFAKQQNSSRIQWATKPLLILLPLMCGTSLIARGRRTQSASSVTVQQDTGQYRSGHPSDAQEASFSYVGLTRCRKGFIFNYTPSSGVGTDRQRKDEAKRVFETTALYRYVIKPLGIELGDDWIDEDAVNGRMVFTPGKVANLMIPKWKEPLAFFHQQVKSTHPHFATKEFPLSNFSIPKSLKLRYSKFKIEELKDHLVQIWQIMRNWGVSQTSQQCMVTIYTNAGKVYLAEKDHFRLIEPNGDLSSKKVDEIKDIVHIYAIRLEGDPPLGFNKKHAIAIDLAKPYSTGRVPQTSRPKLSCIWSSDDKN